MDNKLALVIEKFQKAQGTLLETNARLVEKGKRSLENRKYNQALEFFESSLQLNRQTKNMQGLREALLHKANTLVETGALREALNAYMELAKLDPTSPVFFDIAYVYGEIGDYEKSVKFYQHYLKFSPQDYGALGNIGWAYEQLDKLTEAQLYYELALKIKPNYVSALNRLVILIDRIAGTNKQKRQKAVRIARRALEIYNKKIRREPKNADMLVNKAIALDILGQKGTAIGVYEQALKIDKDNAFAYYNMSCTLALVGRTEESLTHLNKAIRLEHSYRDLAKKDPDFSSLRKNENFKKSLK